MVSPVKSYIICSTPRTGSGLLCSTLRNLGCCGNPGEHFHLRKLQENNDVKNNPKALRDYLSQVCNYGTTPNGIFGVKMHRTHFKVLLEFARQLHEFICMNDIEILSSIFPNPSFIFIWRRDFLKQAISWEIARQTTKWRINKGEALDYINKVKFKPFFIYKHKRAIQVANSEWRHFFKAYSIDFYEIVYEDLINSYQKTILDLVDYIGIDSQISASTITMSSQVQSTQINERWYKYYGFIPEKILTLIVGLRKSLEDYIGL